MKPFLCLLLGVAVLLAAVPALAGGTTLQINQVDNCPTTVVAPIVAQPVYEAQRLRIEVGPTYTERLVQRIETPVVVEKVQAVPVEKIQYVEKVQTVPVERVQVVERVVAPQKVYFTAAPQRVLQLNSHSHQQVLQLNSHHQQAVVLQSRQRNPVLQLNVDNHHHGNNGLAVRQRDGLLGSRTLVRNRR